MNKTNLYSGHGSWRRIRTLAIGLVSTIFLGIPTLAKTIPPTRPTKVSISTEERTPGHTWVKARILIKAPPNVVWYSVHEERKHDPDLAYSKVLEQSENHCLLEQKFTVIPIVGTSVCVMRDTEVPFERIDYELVKSDHFKAMEGSWILTPAEEGKGTFLELSTHTDLGLPIPQAMLTAVTAKKLERRLNNVRVMAEKNNVEIASKLIVKE